MTELDRPRRRRRDAVLSQEFSRGLSALDLAELRSRRKSAEEEEAELSYHRRLLHGRIDAIDAELRRRRESARGPAAVADVVSILAAQAPSSTRHRTAAADASPLVEQRRAVERLLADPVLSYVTVLSTDDLAAAREQLAAVEAEISQERSHVQEVVDSLTAELMLRYRNRQASVDTLLT